MTGSGITEHLLDNPQNTSSEVQEWEKTEQYEELKRRLEYTTKERISFFPKPAQTRMAMALALGKDVTCIAQQASGRVWPSRLRFLRCN